MAQFSANPSSKHMNAAKHILKYLNTTQSVSIIYDGGSTKGLIAFMDSDWASDKIKHRSETSFFFMIAGAIFLWQSWAQKLLPYPVLKLSTWLCLTVVDKQYR